MAVTGKVTSDMPIVRGTVVRYGTGGSTKWQEEWKENVLEIARDDLGLEVIDGLLNAVYSKEDEKI